MSVSATLAVQTMEYEALDREIKRTMHRSAKDVVQLGFLLRQMAEKKMWEAAYACFDDYLDKELHMDYSLATRFMNINRKYSVSGASMEIAEEYEEYSQGLLIEMLNMAPDLEAKVTPDMTVKQAREIKKRAKAEKEASVQFPEKEKETIIDGEYREIREPEAGRVHDESWFVEQYSRIMPDKTAELFEICRKERNNSDRAKAIQKHIAPYGRHGTCCSEYDFVFYGFAAGMDFRIGSDMIHLKYACFVEELMRLLEKEVATSQPEEEKLSPYGLPKTVYPEGSLLTAAGCGHKYSCFSCAQDCVIRQEARYCVEAPMGSPFGCTTMGVLEILKADMGDRCQFVDNGLAYHTAGSNEARPCCRDCRELCGYRCRRSGQDAAVQDNEVPEETGIINELAEIRHILEKEKGILHDYLEAGGLPELTVFRQKTVVAALAAMVCDLEGDKTEQEPQTELPALKNNGQRKKWLEGYKSWGLWYRDENIDVNYYKYDFPDGSRLVAAEYPQRYCYWNGRRKDEHYFRLLEKDKKGYNGNAYDEQYRQQTDSETYLVEFLKNMQKKG